MEMQCSGMQKNVFCVIKVYCHLNRYVTVQVHWNSCAFLRVSFYLTKKYFKGEQGAANILKVQKKSTYTNRLSNLNKYSL